MSNRCSISIVVPVFSEARNLAKLLDGVQSLKLPDTEVVVVDDGSRDGSSEIAEKMGARVLRYAANTVYNLLASYVTKFAVKDLTSGFRVLSRVDALRFIDLLPDTFSWRFLAIDLRYRVEIFLIFGSFREPSRMMQAMGRSPDFGRSTATRDVINSHGKNVSAFELFRAL